MADFPNASDEIENHKLIKTILVEDNALIRESLASTLQELGGIHIAAFAEDAPKAIELLHDNSTWKLAILDLYLKKGNGLKVLSALRSRAPFQKIVVLSNYVTPDIRIECLELGADAVFDKSTELEKLIDYCRSMF